MALKDRILFNKLKSGKGEALGQIYEKYKNDLLNLALSLLDDKTQAEDVVHDVYLAFAKKVKTIQLKSSLKGYLMTSVANRIRNIARCENRNKTCMETGRIGSTCNYPLQQKILSEKFQEVEKALVSLPFEQREVIALHFQADMRFKEIAKAQGISINTALSRYRYAIDKLRSMLNGEV